MAMTAAEIASAKAQIAAGKADRPAGRAGGPAVRHLHRRPAPSLTWPRPLAALDGTDQPMQVLHALQSLLTPTGTNFSPAIAQLQVVAASAPVAGS